MWCKYKAIFPVGKIALDAVGGYGRRCSIWTERAGNKLSVLIGKERKTRILPGQGRTFVSVKQSLHFGETEALFRANKGSILFQIEYLFYFRQSICLDIQSSFFFHSLILFFFIPYSFLFIPLFLPLRLQSQSLNSKLNCSQTPCCSSASSFGLETERPMSRIGCCSNSTLLSNSFASGSTRSKVVSSCD